MNKKISDLPHDRSDFFETEQYKIAVIDFFLGELQRDGQDVTSLLFVDSAVDGSAKIMAKQNGVLAGQSDIDFFIKTKENFLDIKINWKKKDGESVETGDIICEFFGNSIDILNFERVSLNVLSRLSGIATATKNILEKSNTPIASTRKTQWSYLDKKAVFVGGGNTHRIGLFDAVLIKENHLISGKKIDVLQKLLHIQSYAPSEVLKNIKFIEVEVENIEEFYEVFEVFIQCSEKYKTSLKYKYVIMLDNFSPEQIDYLLSDLKNKNLNKKERNLKNIFIEISGGITSENIKNYSDLGADIISLGSLTHSVMPIDFSLRFSHRLQ